MMGSFRNQAKIRAEHPEEKQRHPVVIECNSYARRTKSLLPGKTLRKGRELADLSRTSPHGETAVPETILTEEQKQMSQLLRRCRQAHCIFRNAILCATISCAVWVLLAVLLNRRIGTIFVVNPLLLYLLFLLSLVGRVCVLSSKRRHFVRQLTIEEKELLERASQIAPKSARETAVQVLRIHENLRQSDEQNLLRASQQTQEDTLLRAARYTDTTPQDQLLRPSPTEEK